MDTSSDLPVDECRQQLPPLGSSRSDEAVPDPLSSIRPESTVRRRHPTLLILVTGHPGAGKTTLARRLAADLRLPLISRDNLKETLFDTLGWSDRAWSRRLGGASYELLFHVVETLLATGVSCIAESNFAPEYHTARLAELQHRLCFRVCQVLCTADPETLLRRIRERDESGKRHPGHVDRIAIQDLIERIRSDPGRPLALDGVVLEVDTTDPNGVDYRGLLRKIRAGV